jgi:hypothetical protein
VPGNIRIPHLADAIGGAVCGVIAGVFATGIVMIAFQSMPFGPSIGGYARYEIKDRRDVKALTDEKSNRQVDRVVYDELVNDDLTKGQSGMLLPVDDIVLGMAKRLSNGGALAGARPLESVHPDMLQEFFGQRIGLESAAKHTAFAKGSPAAEVKGVTVMVPQSLPKVSPESPLIRPAPAKGEKLSPAPGKKLVAVTVQFKPEAADDDHIIRIATGNVRIVTQYKDDNGEVHWKNNYPLGTVQPIGGVWSAWINKPDDFLFLKEGGVHFLFELDDSVFTAAADAKPAAPTAEGGKSAGPNAFQLEPGTFIELKRLTRLPLDNVRVKVGVPQDSEKFDPLRKFEVFKEKPAAKTPEPAPTAAAPAQPPSKPGVPTEENGWLKSPLVNPAVVGGDKIPYPIGVGTSEASADVAGAGFDGHLTGKKFDTLNTDVASAESTPPALAKAAPTVDELFVPEGKRMVQVKFKNVGTNPWIWRAMSDRFQVYCEGTKTTYGPYGAYGMLKPPSGGPDRVFAIYRATTQLGKFPEPQGKVDEVTLIYLVPAGQKVSEARFESRPNGLPLTDQ